MTTDEPMDPTTRLITFDWYEELGKKMGFIRSIPNITKIPQPVFDQIMSDPAFHFDVKRSIPMTEWEWNGVIVSKERIRIGCIEVPVFKLNTTIGDFNISTVGSRWRLQTFDVAPYYRPEAVVNHNEMIRAERDVLPYEPTITIQPLPQVTVVGTPRIQNVLEAIQGLRRPTTAEVMAVAQAVVGNNVINISSNASPPAGGGPGQYSRELHFNQGIVHLWHNCYTGEPVPEGIYFDYETRLFSAREYTLITDCSYLEAMQTLSEEEAVAWHYIFCAYYSVLEKE